ncbi:MAG: hypothetical protein GFH27_549285n77 [Chloroflexi bacterium AL-W]|nr:hypothetical protein [Chloroflexi bacterium AL-N1]NOK65589.1 hypothetical protein [Chloroflexi bacterium AL-N10]NOK74470.1 hypothetical protein [Chloroflexi bacterium AL-N5]NOK80622.1 hypothetical protein [Chloroflexi bacterium AL-W]NOK88728.1 hypothetical protein [Chloroflexi bacterium AL-N15]
MHSWGVLSTGGIAQKFVAAVQSSSDVQIAAIASRDAARATEVAQKMGIPQAYGSYEALLTDPKIEAVYIALPNSLHAEWSIKAAQAGKHILCEKPLGVSRTEAEAMFEAARKHRVCLMEAFMYRFHPQTRALQELINNGTVGQVQLVRASFGFTVTDPVNVRLNAELAGGALMDVGCYCVNVVRMITGCAPHRVTAVARWAPSGVDETLLGTLEYPNGILAQVLCSLSSARHHMVQIIGSDGVIEVDEVFTPPPDQPTIIRLRHGAHATHLEEREIEPVNHFRLEAEGFVRLIRDGHGDWPDMPIVETLDNLATIEALLQSARHGQAVQIQSN